MISLQLSTFNFTLLFGESDFHKMKGRETLSRSHNDLNIIDSNTGLRASPHPLSFWKAHLGIKFFVF
jgi:hypothetical protein